MQYLCYKSIIQFYFLHSLKRLVFVPIVSSPRNAPVRLDLEDGRIVCVVELDLWVPQLRRVDVHHDWGGS